ncbi:DUF305 domain-containing protein [Glaciihabitans arcticus]|uniref:DUF305 domain-containing protein n=1 Tax=Glaciihabitans arcticus TaxID=2668039 RepID=A0A4Q9GML2_9MICO|nr:DUF305 domain-containing protein [Glaciihabitans arcticus]TBN55578.1 DUF305 domain-containing protein [Glaciihabitans arcticus]
MDPDSTLSAAPVGGRSIRGTIAVAVVAVLLIVAAFAIGRISAPVSTPPGTTSAEAGFARDMQTHHHQAVEMSFIVRDASDDDEVRLLAFDIATAQGAQAGQMYGWLDTWGLPQLESEPSMTWMTRPPLSGDGTTHAHDDASQSAHTAGDPMPGLATAEQITRLKSLDGVDAERYYLQLMIAHHEGGVLMANAVLERSTERVVVSVAKGIVLSQTTEIEYMQALLERRGGPLPD